MLFCAGGSGLRRKEFGYCTHLCHQSYPILGCFATPAPSIVLPLPATIHSLLHWMCLVTSVGTQRKTPAHESRTNLSEQPFSTTGSKREQDSYITTWWTFPQFCMIGKLKNICFTFCYMKHQLARSRCLDCYRALGCGSLLCSITHSPFRFGLWGNLKGSGHFWNRARSISKTLLVPSI